MTNLPEQNQDTFRDLLIGVGLGTHVGYRWAAGGGLYEVDFLPVGERLPDGMKHDRSRGEYVGILSADHAFELAHLGSMEPTGMSTEDTNG